jgi:ATP-binding cassette subfamily C (CFTR/MRP) protein 4
MFIKVLRTPMSFFDSNPVGRVLNRFSADIGLVDEQLPNTSLYVICVRQTYTLLCLDLCFINYPASN